MWVNGGVIEIASTWVGISAVGQYGGVKKTSVNGVGLHASGLLRGWADLRDFTVPIYSGLNILKEGF